MLNLSLMHMKKLSNQSKVKWMWAVKDIMTDQLGDQFRKVKPIKETILLLLQVLLVNNHNNSRKNKVQYHNYRNLDVLCSFLIKESKILIGIILLVTIKLKETLKTLFYWLWLMVMSMIKSLRKQEWKMKQIDQSVCYSKGHQVVVKLHLQRLFLNKWISLSCTCL